MPTSKSLEKTDARYRAREPHATLSPLTYTRALLLAQQLSVCMFVTCNAGGAKWEIISFRVILRECTTCIMMEAVCGGGGVNILFFFFHSFFFLSFFFWHVFCGYFDFSINQRSKDKEGACSCFLVTMKTTRLTEIYSYYCERSFKYAFILLKNVTFCDFKFSLLWRHLLHISRILCWLLWSFTKFQPLKFKVAPLSSFTSKNVKNATKKKKTHHFWILRFFDYRRVKMIEKCSNQYNQCKILMWSQNIAENWRAEILKYHGKFQNIFFRIFSIQKYT